MESQYLKFMYLSPRGRINRREYGIFFTRFAMIYVAFFYALMWTIPDPVAFRLWLQVVWIIVGHYVAYCLLAKRLHDGGYTGLWALLLYDLLAIWLICGKLVPPAIANFYHAHMLGFVVAALFPLFALCCSLIRSDAAENRFGAPTGKAEDTTHLTLYGRAILVLIASLIGFFPIQISTRAAVEAIWYLYFPRAEIPEVRCGVGDPPPAQSQPVQR